MPEEALEGAATTGPLQLPPPTEYVVRSLRGSSWTVEFPPNKREFWRLLDALEVGLNAGSVKEVVIRPRDVAAPVSAEVADPPLELEAAVEVSPE